MAKEPGSGERAELARSRKFWWILGSLMLLGGVLGGIHAVLTGGNPADDLPAGWAVAMVALFLLGIVAGSIYFFRSVDEVEVRDNLIASTVAIYFYTTLYPAWYILWKGGLVREPQHALLFLGTLLVMIFAYLWKKIRP